eukprot:scaffold8918_cov91-Skeletonema_dohrnii-CCMP3373.AAC.1
MRKQQQEQSRYPLGKDNRGGTDNTSKLGVVSNNPAMKTSPNVANNSNNSNSNNSTGLKPTPWAKNAHVIKDELEKHPPHHRRGHQTQPNHERRRDDGRNGPTRNNGGGGSRRHGNNDRSRMQESNSYGNTTKRHDNTKQAQSQSRLAALGGTITTSGKSNTNSNSNNTTSSARGHRNLEVHTEQKNEAAATTATAFHTTATVKLESAQIKGRWADEDSSDDED